MRSVASPPTSSSAALEWNGNDAGAFVTEFDASSYRALFDATSEALFVHAADGRILLVNARGATMFVTLEPCCHHGKTPPCTEAILTAGIARVVVAMRDPYPQVDGRGLKQLAARGVDVELGLGEDQARQHARVQTCLGRQASK